MEAAPPPSATTDRGGGESCAAAPRPEAQPAPVCPRCGAGSLVSLALRRPAGGFAVGVYCAGASGASRLRGRRPSCGYAGIPEPRAPSERAPG
jgi:hypothetical protein